MSTFTEILFYVIGTSSMSYVLAKGWIFGGLKYRILCLIRRRKRSFEDYLAEFLYCPLCIGFWVGVVCEIKVGFFVWTFGWLGYLLSGAITAVLAMILDSIINRNNEE